ncbi:MAG: FAD-binding protein [Methanomassiliicoccales archaeon]
MTANTGIWERWLEGRRELLKSISGYVTDGSVARNGYSVSSGIYSAEPVAVVMPRKEEDVRETIMFCEKYHIPLTVRGAGTSPNGASIGTGIVLDMSRYMNRILEIRKDAMRIRVQAGASIESINLQLGREGLLFPVLPVRGWSATAGGCMATGERGYLSGCFGGMKERTLALRIMDGKGVVHVCSAGGGQFNTYEDRENLFFADDFEHSEGAAGVILELELSVVAYPARARSTLFMYDDMNDAITDAEKFRQVAISCVLMDKATCSAFLSLLGLSVQARKWALLLIHEKVDEMEKGVAINSNWKEVLMTFNKALKLLMRPDVGNRRYVAGLEGFHLPGQRIRDFVELVVERAAELSTNVQLFGHDGGAIMYARPSIETGTEQGLLTRRHFIERCLSLMQEREIDAIPETSMGVYGQTLMKLAGETRKKRDRLRGLLDPNGLFRSACDLKPREMGIQEINGEFFVKQEMNWDTPEFPSRKHILSTLHDELLLCHGCGDCKTQNPERLMCPVYSATGSELASPKGVASTANATLKSMFDRQTMDSDMYRRAIFDFCIECRLCAFECPTFVNVPKLVIEARASYMQLNGPAGVGRCNSFFSDYELYTLIASSVASLSNRLMKSRYARAILEHAFGIDRRAAIHEFNRETLTDFMRKHEVPHPGREIRGEVAYFSDGYANYLDPSVGKAAVRLLESCGYIVRYPKQRFSGLPLIHLGMRREAMKYVVENVSSLYPFAIRSIPIVCSSPTSLIALKYDYLMVLDDERSRSVSNSIVDVHSLLLPAHQKPEAKTDRRIAYFPSCHAVAAGTVEDIKSLLKRYSTQVVELHSSCCGAGGNYALAKETHSLSMEIGRRTFEAVRQAANGGYEIVTDAEDCAMHIIEGTGVRVRHTLPVIEEMQNEIRGAVS